MPYLEVDQYTSYVEAQPFWPLGMEGQSGESEWLVRESLETLVHYYFPITRETTAQKFRALADWWREETAHLSSTTQIAMHPAYQQIIGMGSSVVPLLLQELKREPAQWFWALMAITGVDPVSPDDRGRILTMAGAWLRWGRKEGYIRG